jgi:hypothetical protein
MSKYLKSKMGYNLQCYELRERLGLRPGKLPEGSVAPQDIDGVLVYVLSARDAALANPKSLRPHRVMAICPDCRDHLPAGRLHQHKCLTIEKARKLLGQWEMVWVPVKKSKSAREGAALVNLPDAKWMVKQVGEPCYAAPFYTDDLAEAVSKGVEIGKGIQDYLAHLEAEAEQLAEMPDSDTRHRDH